MSANKSDENNPQVIANCYNQPISVAILGARGTLTIEQTAKSLSLSLEKVKIFR